MKIEAALFDLDGTLVDTLSISYEVFRNAVVASSGPRLTDADIHGMFGPSEDGMMQRALPDGGQNALDLYFAEYQRLLPTCPTVFPDLIAVLSLLRDRRIQTAVVTGKSRMTAIMSLRHFGLENSFDAVETGSPAGVVKAEAIARLLDGWGIDREAAIYVGDAAVDMRAAREVGVTAVGAAWPYGARVAELEPAGANLIFTDARDFAAWLRGVIVA